MLDLTGTMLLAWWGQKPPREAAWKETDLLKDLTLQRGAVKGERRAWD